MSPHPACAPQGAALFPDLPSSPPWPEADHADDASDSGHQFPPQSADESFSDAELVHLAQSFLERSESLIDAVAPPAWEDPDDMFGGEVFDGEQAQYRRMSAANPTSTHKGAVARHLMANEESRYPGCTDTFLIALALTYRHILLDRAADPRDKVEILRRVYSRHEPEWMTAEIVYLHFVLLDQCRCLCRPAASLDRKEETLRWIFTDPEREDRPFSFKNCVRLVLGNTPEFGSVHRRIQEQLRPYLQAWLEEALLRRRTANERQGELFGA